MPNRFLLDEPPDSTNITYAGGQGNYLLYQQADLTMGVRAYPTQGTLQSVLDTGSGKQRYVFDQVNEYGFPTGYFRFFLRRYSGSTLISKAVIDAEIQLMEAY